jgi:protein-S-isoprenylcysteine O-methyltransferase Ste14
MATLRIPQMADASGGSFVYNHDMVTETKANSSKPARLVRGIKHLLGVGMHLLILGLFLEGLAVVVHRWLSFPISLTAETQILFTVLCATVCLLGAIWFNRSLDLIKVHLLNGKNELITGGPFTYVRHPLYATLLLAIPPLVIIWSSDLLFFVPGF